MLFIFKPLNFLLLALFPGIPSLLVSSQLFHRNFSSGYLSYLRFTGEKIPFHELSPLRLRRCPSLLRLMLVGFLASRGAVTFLKFE